jgi:hypothetical protein
MENHQRGEGLGLGEGQQAGSRGMSISGRVSVRSGENSRATERVMSQ